MVRATCRRLAREDGIWSVLAASAVAAMLLAALALSLDLAAATSARSTAQSALDAALRSAAHDIVPGSIASTTPTIASQTTAHALRSALRQLAMRPLGIRLTAGPTIQGSRLSAAILVTVPLPALLGRIRIPVQGEVAVGWLPH